MLLRFAVALACINLALDNIVGLGEPPAFDWIPLWLHMTIAAISIPVWLWFAVKIWREGVE